MATRVSAVKPVRGTGTPAERIGAEQLRLRQAPLLLAALPFAAGIILGALAWRPPMLLLLTFAASALVLLLSLGRGLRMAWLPVVALWFALGAVAAEMQPGPPTAAALQPYADGLSRTLRGRVVRVRPLQPLQTADRDRDATTWQEDKAADTAGDQTARAVSIDIALDGIEEVTPDSSRIIPASGGVRLTLSGGLAADTASRNQTGSAASSLSRTLLLSFSQQLSHTLQLSSALQLSSSASASSPQIRCGEEIELPARLQPPPRYGDPGVWQYADYLAEQGVVMLAKVAPREQAHLEVLATPPTLHQAWHDGSIAETLACQVRNAQTWASDRIAALAPRQSSQPGSTNGAMPRNHAPSRGIVTSRGDAASDADRALPKTPHSADPMRLLPPFLRPNADDTAMMSAMLVGDRTRLDGTLRLCFERTATFHLFVVSGVHVALLAGLTLWLLTRLRLPRLPATLVTIAAIAGYATLTGFAPPAQRALVMTSVYLIARLLDRTAAPLQAIAAAVLAVLLFDPHALFTASFQMTMLVLIAIAGLALPLAQWSISPYARATQRLDERWTDIAMPPRIAQFRVTLRLWQTLLAQAYGSWTARLLPLLVRGTFWFLELWLVALVAELVMALPMAFYFHRLTPMAQPANLLLLPIIGLLLPSALLTFLASLVSPWLALVPAAITAGLLHGMRAAVLWLGAQPGADTRVPGPPLVISIAAVLGWIVLCWIVRRSRRLAWTTAAILPVLTLTILWPYPLLRTPGKLEVDAIDVGQGDSLFVVGPDGRTMLIDAGGPVGPNERAPTASSTRWEIGEEVVCPSLWSRRLRRLDVVVLSHAHSDHMGGMPAVLRNLRPRELWVGIDPDSAAYRALLAEAADLHILVRHLHTGDAPSFGETQVKVLAPEPGYRNAGEPTNSDSLVLRLTYGHASVLLEGDAEARTEQQMVADGLKPVTLLKVGHHGSLTSTTQPFLNAAQPRMAVVSVGRGNTFGHPRFEILNRLQAEGARVYRTDELGMSRFLLGPDGSIVASAWASNSDGGNGP
jgi:competence protein ComEC